MQCAGTVSQFSRIKTAVHKKLKDSSLVVALNSSSSSSSRIGLGDAFGIETYRPATQDQAEVCSYSQRKIKRETIENAVFWLYFVVDPFSMMLAIFKDEKYI